MSDLFERDPISKVTLLDWQAGSTPTLTQKTIQHGLSTLSA